MKRERLDAVSIWGKALPLAIEPPWLESGDVLMGLQLGDPNRNGI